MQSAGVLRCKSNVLESKHWWQTSFLVLSLSWGAMGLLLFSFGALCSDSDGLSLGILCRDSAGTVQGQLDEYLMAMSAFIYYFSQVFAFLCFSCLLDSFHMDCLGATW